MASSIISPQQYNTSITPIPKLYSKPTSSSFNKTTKLRYNNFNNNIIRFSKPYSHNNTISTKSSSSTKHNETVMEISDEEMDRIRRLQNGSDVRGVALEGEKGRVVDLTPPAVEAIAESFGEWVVKNNVSVTSNNPVRVSLGKDPRVSGPTLSVAVFAGLALAGCVGFDTGLANTPACFMSTVLLPFAFDASIMISSSNTKTVESFILNKSTLGVQVGAILATVYEQPALALTGMSYEQDLNSTLIQSAIVAFLYLIVAPPIIMNWLRLRWYRRNLLETYFQFMFVFIFFPGVLLWAPFLNFRKFPRDPDMKYPWDKPKDPSKIRNTYSKYPYADADDYDYS